MISQQTTLKFMNLKGPFAKQSSSMCPGPSSRTGL